MHVLVHADLTSENSEPESWLEDSAAIRNDPEALRKSMEENGYLYIRNFRPERWPAGAPTAVDDD